jgi:hypothetical protein
MEVLGPCRGQRPNRSDGPMLRAQRIDGSSEAMTACGSAALPTQQSAAGINFRRNTSRVSEDAFGTKR